MPFELYCVQPLVGVVPAQNAELMIGGAAIQSMFQPKLAAKLGGMPGEYTNTRKPVAVIKEGDDPPVVLQWPPLPARLLEMIGG